MEWRCPMQQATAFAWFRALVVGGRQLAQHFNPGSAKSHLLYWRFTRQRLAVQGDCRRRPERQLAGG
jgi:hypothetical protein